MHNLFNLFMNHDFVGIFVLFQFCIDTDNWKDLDHWAVIC